jgi:nitrate reductase beta subunit
VQTHCARHRWVFLLAKTPMQLQIPSSIIQAFRAGLSASNALQPARAEHGGVTVRDIKRYYNLLTQARLNDANGIPASPYLSKSECNTLARQVGVDYDFEMDAYYEPVGFHPPSPEQLRAAAMMARCTIGKRAERGALA